MMGPQIGYIGAGGWSGAQDPWSGGLDPGSGDGGGHGERSG